ncbi:dUTP diphosphatase [Metabacillus sp. FJAT-53654]|uniref:dUTP diphosphatase n=1 Tax=Metabacillus rhizosphaerae TaxID=3117747 RepID=A0ABZ2MZ60_9BACI
MNLQKLFEMQKGLRDHIGYDGPDRFNKLILALLVEVGECANEWRGFKFWSTNQQPRTLALRHPAMMEEDKEYYNPLLEEYVDGLHFVLELALEIAYEIQFDVCDYISEIDNDIKSQEQKSKNIIEQFNTVFYFANTVNYDCEYSNLFAAYYYLGEMLGFTWDQIEQAYMDKNKINHERQESGY